MKRLIVIILILLIMLSGCTVNESNDRELSACDQIQNQNDKDVCYLNVAIAREDISICDKIDHQYRKDTYYDFVSRTKEANQ